MARVTCEGLCCHRWGHWRSFVEEARPCRDVHKVREEGRGLQRAISLLLRFFSHRYRGGSRLGSAVLDGEKAALHRDEYGVSSIIGAEFRHHIFHVSLHRVFGD